MDSLEIKDLQSSAGTIGFLITLFECSSTVYKYLIKFNNIWIVLPFQGYE